jgi:DNA-directed RNA polymerase subunit RPC12/RpoP
LFFVSYTDEQIGVLLDYSNATCPSCSSRILQART